MLSYDEVTDNGVWLGHDFYFASDGNFYKHSDDMGPHHVKMVGSQEVIDNLLVQVYTKIKTMELDAEIEKLKVKKSTLTKCK